ncbi:bifunctional Orc1-like [Babesia duncani]|uniref:Origin recognition complex subunit 1 n=1 Tax=Babesia duncani TaxID=323732 RepID=A0AAD9PIP3_9APIC|nr:bifunctional Orc1-like [Babesia duncani]
MSTENDEIEQHIARQERAIELLRMSDNEYLGCRDRELKEIDDFLESCISRNSGGAMFIFGMSGTGKTTTVQHALSTCKEKNPQIRTLSISGSSFSTFKELAKELFESLVGMTDYRIPNLINKELMDYRKLCILMTSLFQKTSYTFVQFAIVIPLGFV